MILCCGEALIDMLPHDARIGRPTWSAFPGGAIFNAAVALGRLAVPAGIFTGLSSDSFGDMLRADLTAASVDHSLCSTSHAKTALAFVVLKNGQAQYSFHDAASAHRMLTPDHRMALPAEVSALFFGGISLAVEPCGDTLEALLRKERASRIVMLDPNVRPAFVRDEAAYRARLGRMMALSEIVKVSDEDLEWLVTEGRDLNDRMAQILGLGPSIVVVTRGQEGAVAATASGLRVSVPAPHVKVVDTVGAGDTFNAGFLARLHDSRHLNADAIAAISEEALTEAVAYGIKAASIVVARSGAQAPTRAEIDTHLSDQ